MRWTGRADGDLGVARQGSKEAWEAVTHGPVSWLRQVHGARVVVVDAPPGVQGEEGDALVTTRTGLALAVFTADCAPVALGSPEGVLGAVHAGWAGLGAGVLEGTVSVMRSLGATRVVAALGPCIHPECYPFGAGDLDRVAARLGDSVRGVTASGAPALDLPAAVRSALGRAGAELVHDEGACTACALDGHRRARYFSHRARGDAQRQAMVVWRE
ncbi:MAG: polyphenol oxidase family protein [Actinomycetota bacterium]|nr:polyphenol oxidase family protein [Actinomycetota bacterium]